ncbi:MAG: hypothetical protein LC129_05940 [Burkholderiales bacterium]|nr:hypothetical protein [Burkholderiales bacterium]
MEIMLREAVVRILKDRGAWLLLAGLAGLLATGCAPSKVDESQAPPPVALMAEYDTGTPLSAGPAEAGRKALALTDALSPMRVMVMVLPASLSQQAGQPMSAYARLITSVGGSRAVLPSAELTSSLRMIQGDAAQAFWREAQVDRVLIQQRGLLSPEVTMRLRIIPQSDAPPLANGLTLAMTPLAGEADAAAPGLRLSATVTGQIESRRRGRRAASSAATQQQASNNQEADDADPSAALSSSQTRTETLVVDLSAGLAGESPLVILWLMPDTPSQPGRWLAISLWRDGEPVSAEELQAVNDSLERSRQAALAQPTTMPSRFASQRADIAATLELLAQKRSQRSAMLSLASLSGAPLTGDLALVMDDLLLEALASQIIERVAQLPASQADTLGWVMDRTALELAAGQASPRARESLSGVLATHLGEPARRPALMQDLLESMRTRLEFQTRLHAENLISLEDDSPASRVRAHQWLVARDLAPAGYDPLGSPQSRRQALENASSTTAAPTAGVTP